MYAQWTTYDHVEFQYIVAYVPTDYLRQPTQQEIWDALARHINSQKSTMRIRGSYQNHSGQRASRHEER